ncbi:cytochrome ubiquinol oxidase subunit I [Aliibacillus thermotolerans]|uniref:Cytochrome ubiquinol oxidase subunit I n=1 Tax=Aliibacillus thermotolerans TaxID=1834418 RepID=A0ABW0U4J5_9BACI|nr:cytochrome ubiquinol oxidase subunit I [Aliibacillus thermotolerans]
MIFQSVPVDLELAIPGNWTLLMILLVVSFLMHIVFANLTIAGAFYAVWNEIRGMVKNNPVYDQLASQSATMTSIFKSIAVVLGVAPLLLVSVLYTQYIYPATIFIGEAWLNLLWILIVAFLLLYLYKFSWNRLKNKGLHLTIGLIGTMMLLIVPLIFIVAVVSMLYPDKWAGAEGFFHSLFYYPQIWQRYFHFILASFAVTGLVMYFWNKRKLTQRTKLHAVDGKDEVAATTENVKEDVKVYEAGKSFGMQAAFWTTALQLVIGPLVLFSLDREVRLLYLGDDVFLTSLLSISTLLSVVLIGMLFMLMKTEAKKWLLSSLTTLVLVIGLMGWMRHEVRESYIDPHRAENPPTIEQQPIQIGDMMIE